MNHLNPAYLNTFIPFKYIESLDYFGLFFITIPISFYYTLKLTVSETINKIHIALFAIILLISYFRTNAYGQVVRITNFCNIVFVFLLFINQ